jgi:hypothetical protein
MLVLVLQYLVATPIHLVLATRHVKPMLAYLPSTRHLIESNLTESLSGVILFLMASDSNAKLTDLNSTLITATGSLLPHYSDRNSCLIHEPDSLTTASYTYNATTNVLHRVLFKDFVLQVHLTLFCTQFGSPAHPDWHVSIILSEPTRPLRRQANGLGCIPGLPWRQTPR